MSENDDELTPETKLIVTWTEVATDSYRVECTAQELADLMGCEVSEIEDRLELHDHDLCNDLADWNGDENHYGLDDFQREDIDVVRK